MKSKLFFTNIVLLILVIAIWFIWYGGNEIKHGLRGHNVASKEWLEFVATDTQCREKCANEMRSKPIKLWSQEAKPLPKWQVFAIGLFQVAAMLLVIFLVSKALITKLKQ